MTAKEALLDLVTKLPEESAVELLEMAKSVLDSGEEEDWRGAALRHFNSAYGDNDPEYTEGDIRRETHT